MSSFDPNSTDSVLSRILTELQGVREDFKDHREKSEKRLRDLETEKNYRHGWTAAIALGVSAVFTALVEYFRK